MGSYAYKDVRDQLPPYLTTDDPEYEGTTDYDGDMWTVASEYIYELEQEIVKQYENSKWVNNKRLFNWLKTRPKTSYNEGAVIKD